MLVLEKPHSDHHRDIYFWQWKLADRRVLFSNHQTNFTPFWCEWCSWGSSEPCQVCAVEGWYPFAPDHAPDCDGDGGA